MKTTLISRIGLALLSMLLILSSFAQNDFGKKSAYRVYPEKSGDFFPSLKYDNNMTTEKISKKVFKNFSRQFHNTINVKWEQHDGNFLATFVRDETTTRSLFNKNGRLIYTIDYTSEDQLPSDIKSMITTKYEDYKITYVAKVKEDNREIWVLKLAGKKDYVTARVEDGEMEETENLQRGN